MVSEWDIVIRLSVALLLGGVIGYERQASNKAAGLRTHVLVCIGSCLIMILSLNIYYNVQGMTNADPARLAAQVVSGIGFLGAGTIMKEGITIKGLTTAASLWVVSGVGLAVGSGYFISAFFATGLVFLTLSLLSRFEPGLLYNDPVGNEISLVIKTVKETAPFRLIYRWLGESGLQFRDIKIEENQGNQRLYFLLNCPAEIDVSEITSKLMEVKGVLSVNIRPGEEKNI